MKKILYVATVVKTHIMEFHVPYLKMLKEMGWETAVAARNDYENMEECCIPYCDNYFNLPFERNPMKLGNIKAYKELKRIIDNGEYDIVHCHTPVGAMITRMAARTVRKSGCKVIYTAHGFHFFSGAPLKNWLIYYPVEKLLARMTDVIITINQEDYSRAKKFKAGKVCYVPGVGIDISRFKKNGDDYSQKRKELGLRKDDFVVLSVGELIARKNHKVVMEAINLLKETEEYQRVQYVICGSGILEKELRQTAERLKIDNKVHFLGYRRDVSEICNCSDVFAFMSLQEGLPVALMEAMACGLLPICSRVRGNTDLVKNRFTGYIVDNNCVEVSKAIHSCMTLKEEYDFICKNLKDSMKQYELTRVQNLVKKIYLDVLD